MTFPWELLSDDVIELIGNDNRMHAFGNWCSASTHTQSQSLLVKKFPAEVRNRIWTMLVGDRVLHPVEITNHGWKSTTCVNERTPQQLYDLSRTPDDAFFSRDGCSSNTGRDSVWSRIPSERKHMLVRMARSAQFGHHDCPGSVKPFRVGIEYVKRAEPDFLANLSIMRACKKFHTEIVHTFWTTNTFSFSEIVSWMRFIRSVGITERAAIRSVDLRFLTCEVNCPLRCPRLDLRGLRNLHLHIRECKHIKLSQHSMAATSGYIRRLLEATELQNTNITVIIDNATSGICWCHGATMASNHDGLVLTHKACLDMADTMSQQVKSANIEAQITRSTSLTYSPISNRLTNTATSAHKAMYVCNAGSTPEECIRFHHKVLRKRFGNRHFRVKPCDAAHRCLDCRKREGTSLPHGASYHCPRPGNCSGPARYVDVNPNVMPVDDIGSGYEAGEEDNDEV